MIIMIIIIIMMIMIIMKILILITITGGLHHKISVFSDPDPGKS